MHQLPRAMLFDLDGTILDWQTGMDEHWRAACEIGCEQLGGIELDPLLSKIRERRDWFWADSERARIGRLDLDQASVDIVQLALTDLGAESDGVADAIAKDYRGRRFEALAPYPGAIETLEALRSRGMPLALITNGGSFTQRRSIERFDLARFFECIVVEGEFGCGKPDERVFHHALSAVTCDPGDAWMIGDNLEADIATPVRLGMHAIWVDEMGDGLPADTAVAPHRTIRAIRELL